MKSKLLIIAFVAALTTSFAAVAADDGMGKDIGNNMSMPADKADAVVQPVKNKFRRHNHSEFNKQGFPVAEPSTTSGPPAKPLHDHRKVHKQQ